MHSDDIIYKTPKNYDLVTYMDTVAEELKKGILLFKDKTEKKVVVFGSARIKPEDEIYQSTVKLGSLLSEKGYAVMTGGGPGIMEAALKGAFENNGETYGINIILPNEQHDNVYIKDGFLCSHLFTRKVILMRDVAGYIVMPGGFGTLDELFDALTLMATNIQYHLPLVLVGVEFWSGLLSWIKQQVLKHELINEEELNMIKLTDDIEEAVSFIK